MISLNGKKITASSELSEATVVPEVLLPIENTPDINDLPSTIHIAADTEYQQKDLMQVLCVTAYLPHADKLLYFDEDELTTDWSIAKPALQKLGYTVEHVNRRKAQDLLTKHWKQYCLKSSTKKKDIEDLRKNKVLQIECENCGVDIKECNITLNKRNEIRLGFKRFTINLVMFFAYADLFKIFGRDKGYLFSEESKMQQFRTIKVMGNIRETYSVNGVVCDFKYTVFDCRYVFPPVDASLKNQLKVFQIEGSKVSISEEIKRLYGDTLIEQWCMENMATVKLRYPDIFKHYATMDALRTWQLYLKLQLLMKDVCEILEIDNDEELGETCGGNIAKVLFGLIYKHFGASDKETKTLLKSIIKKGTAKYLSELRGNDYGVLPFLTTGGLLFTRCVEHPLIEGKIIDIDESSCYATSLTNMSVYLGQPRVNTFYSVKPKLRDRIDDALKLNVPIDAIYWHVSGKLNKAINTLVLSDLRFKEDSTIASDYKAFSFSEVINDLKDSINLFDATKVTEPSSYSKILTKEVWFGKVTFATLTALKDLPEDWYEEYLDLEVLAEVYYDHNLICDTLEEYQERVKTLPDDIYQITDIPEPELGKSTKSIATKSNLSLRFPISISYIKIKNLRGKYKDDGNPIQEVFKLILNSTYGIMASLQLKCNNPVAANWITSCARAAAWRMTYATNGLHPITDGTPASCSHIPYGLKFRDILKQNPNYMLKFDPNIVNDVDKDWVPTNQWDFNDKYIEHLENFIGGNDWLTRLFKYELKDEKSKEDPKKYYTYHSHYNTGAGNYVKTGEWGNTQKTRSYQKSKRLAEWFKSCCSTEYIEHLIYVENEVIKLSQGSEDAIRILKDAENLANRPHARKSAKMTEELAIEIVQEGIAHPMGFSKQSVKLMKLISISQFNCQDVEQFKALNRVYGKLNGISKDILPTRDWKKNLNIELLEQFTGYDSRDKAYSIEFKDYDYARLNVENPIGLGFEVLIFGNEKLKTLKDVRCRINELLEEYKLSGKKNQFKLDAYLNLARTIKNLKNNEYLVHLLAATQVLKLNFQMKYRNVLCASQLQPTLRNVTFSDLTYLKSENEKIE